MSADSEGNVSGPAVERPVVLLLACTACELVYEPDVAAFTAGCTGCPRCGGWTWIAQLGSAGSPAVASADRPVGQQGLTRHVP